MGEDGQQDHLSNLAGGSSRVPCYQIAMPEKSAKINLPEKRKR